MKHLLLPLILVLFLSSCDNNDDPAPTTANLTLSFDTSWLSDEEKKAIVANIFSVDYLNEPLYSGLTMDDSGKIELKDLNEGNYIITGYKLKDKLIQINAGKNKTLNYQRNDNIFEVWSIE